jgi:coproporphyrinogen III oxidase-like Fe-S oxidoreductase
MGTGTGALGGAAAGALVGGIVGMVQDARDRKEQDRLAQERAYQQENAKKKAEEAKLKAEMDEELAIAQGFRISNIELDDATKKFESSAERLKRLQDERSAALAKKKMLDETREKTLSNEAKIAQLEEELARLKGDDLQVPSQSADMAQKKPGPSTTPPPPAVKPGT